MQNIVRKETISLEVFFSAQETKPVYKFLFPDNENLRNVKIWGFQMYYNTILTTADLLYKRPLINKADFQNTFVNMYDKKNVNFLIFAPAVVFQTIQDNQLDSGRPDAQINDRDAKFFTGQILDFPNCYLSIVNDASLTKDRNLTYVFDVYYSRIDLDEGINPVKYN